MKSSGIVLSIIGAAIIAYSKLDRNIIKKDTLSLSENLKERELITPVTSELKIRLNGKKEQKGHILLYKKLIIQTAYGPRPNNVPPQKKVIKKGNGKFTFDLESDTHYYLAVHVEPFVPLTIDYIILKRNYHQEQLYSLGVALIATGFGIAFS